MRFMNITHVLNKFIRKQIYLFIYIVPTLYGYDFSLKFKKKILKSTRLYIVFDG